MSWYKILKSLKPAIQERMERQSAWLDTQKRLFANFLQRKSEKLTTAQKKTGIILFMIFGIVLCSYVTYTGFRGDGHTKLKVPGGRVSSGTVLRMGESIESLKERSVVQNLIRFKHYMDSLKNTPEGRLIYDSLIAGRPGLMDSLNYIINNQ
jgi:hypothetical protein